MIMSSLFKLFLSTYEFVEKSLEGLRWASSEWENLEEWKEKTSFFYCVSFYVVWILNEHVLPS